MSGQIQQQNKDNDQSGPATQFQIQSDGESTLKFVDQRPGAVAQRKLQEMANNSPRLNRVAQLQSMMDNLSNKEQQPIQRQENNTGLPDNLKSGMEKLSGYSMDDVRVHRNSDKPAQLQAHAYAQGTDIHLGPGQEKHLPHELGHVVQQKEGRVKPTIQMKGKININDDIGLEKEADVLGQKAMNQGRSSFDNTSELIENNPTAQLVVQKADTLRFSDAQITAAKDNPVSDAQKASVTSNSSNDPLTHPMFSTFKARISSLFSSYPPPDGVDLDSLTENIWIQICNSINSSSEELARTPSNDTFSDVKLGYVSMASAGFKRAMKDFDFVMSVLQKFTSAQFFKAKSFGFWSKPEGKEFAEKMTDLTLETSGIGALFDGMPSLNAQEKGKFKNAWDAQLWGSLSQAFAQAVAKQMMRDITVNVCAGGGTDKTNIFGIIEKKALEKGAFAVGKTLEEACTFHSIAAKGKKHRQVDYTIKEGSLPGTWYSGNSWDNALRIGSTKFANLPD